MAYSYGIHNNIQSFKYIWFQKHCCLTTSNDVATQNLFTETLIFFELTIVMFTNNIKLYKQWSVYNYIIKFQTIYIYIDIEQNLYNIYRKLKTI